MLSVSRNFLANGLECICQGRLERWECVCGGVLVAITDARVYYSSLMLKPVRTGVSQSFGC